MNTPLYIAKKLILDKKSKKNISNSIIRLAIFGIALGLATMVVTISVVTGFKKEIRNKVIGFGAHIQITNFDLNTSYETIPISKNQDFYPDLESFPGIRHIQIYATKLGIIKTQKDIHGIVIKGISSDFDWSFFKQNMVEGKIFTVNDTITSNEIVISKYISTLLNLKVDDDIAVYFIQDPPRMRRFKISGIYNTSLEDWDKITVLGDIKHIQKLNKWRDDQISGFEILINDFEKINDMTSLVYDQAGIQFFDDGSKLKIQNIIQKFPQIFDWLGLFNMNVIIILILMLIVAAINMISGLLVLILERINMIGTLKALGANNNYIRNVFLNISGYLIIKGLIWGNLIGIGLSLLQYHFHFIKLDPSAYFLRTVPINLNIMHIILLNICTFTLILIFLLLPSLIISKISPVKTIRFN